MTVSHWLFSLLDQSKLILVEHIYCSYMCTFDLEREIFPAKFKYLFCTVIGYNLHCGDSIDF